MPLRLILSALLLTVTAIAYGQVRVVASIAPYGDLARLVGGEAVDVTVMLPNGASPHTFEPTPRHARELAGADLILLNGGSDEWLHEMAEAVAPDVPLVEALAVLADELEPLEAGADGDESDHADLDPHDHGAVNPHVWLDPLLMSRVAVALGEALAAVDPEQAQGYRERAEAAAHSLADLDTELRELLEPVRGAPFIPFHDAWPYFARRYGLDLVLEIEPFPGREPSPRYLVTVIEAIRESGAPAIFDEAGLSGRAARVLADEAGVELHTLDPLGRAGESYAELMRRNARTIVEALATPETR